MPVADPSLTGALTRDECLELLAERSVARVAYTHRALPAIAPVTCVVSGDDLLLRPHPGGLAARLDGQVVAVEVDDAQEGRHHAWVVVVRGLARTEQAPGGAQVRLALTDVRGRRVRAVP